MAKRKPKTLAIATRIPVGILAALHKLALDKTGLNLTRSRLISTYLADIVRQHKLTVPSTDQANEYLARQWQGTPVQQSISILTDEPDLNPALADLPEDLFNAPDPALAEKLKNLDT